MGATRAVAPSHTPSFVSASTPTAEPQFESSAPQFAFKAAPVAHQPASWGSPQVVRASTPTVYQQTSDSPPVSNAELGTAQDPESERPWTGPESEAPERRTSFLPLFADEARERGYKLPLPFGSGVNFMYIKRPTQVNGVKAGVNGGGLNDVNFLSFAADARVSTAVARFDTWILPVVNVYVTGGYVWNKSTVDVIADLPGAPGTPFTANGDLEGPTYGAGITAAGGFKEFFATLDFNANRVELGGLSNFDAKLSSLRVGWNTTMRGAQVRLWTGTMYWDTARTISGTIQTGQPGIQSIEFAVDQKPVDPWTILLGSTVTLREELWFLLELQGWQDTQAILAGFTFRF